MPYKLSDAEAQLYKAVTDYVREEFNRAEALQNDKRAGTVGFALTILQRRLASSPEAIYQSLRRRRERLESRLRELELLQRGGQVGSVLDADVLRSSTPRMSRTWTTRPTTRSRRPRSRSSTRPRRRARSTSCRPRSRR